MLIVLNVIMRAEYNAIRASGFAGRDALALRGRLAKTTAALAVERLRLRLNSL